MASNVYIMGDSKTNNEYIITKSKFTASVIW